MVIAFDTELFGGPLLAVEFLDDAIRLTHTVAVNDIYPLAAEWIGQFHRDFGRLGTVEITALPKYESYYHGWVERTLSVSRSLPVQRSWLKHLCLRWRQIVAPLLAAPPVIIHGEYYPMNIMYGRESIWPVDWESAAIAAGEIDLATLTRGWPRRQAHAMESSYRAARWSEASAPEDKELLAAARMYTCFRELGQDQHSAGGPAASELWATLLTEAQLVGLL